MSLFATVPSEFPFDVELSRRPANYRLQKERTEAFVAIGLSLMWVVLGPLLIVSLVETFADGSSVPHIWFWVQAVLCAAFLVWAIFIYFGPEVLSHFRVVDVQIGETQIDVVDRRLMLIDRWSLPLSEFKGVALMDLGTHLINDNKEPVASVVLQHSDPARSVPVSFRLQKQIGQRTVKRIAEQLNMTPIAGVSGGFEESVYEKGTIVINRRQALKVRILYWSILIVGLIILGSLSYHAVAGSLDMTQLVLSILILSIMVPMHIYASIYVVEMKRLDETVSVTTAALLGARHNLDRHKINAVSSQRGKLLTYRHRINTPWVNIWVNGRSLPFIVDMQSDYVASKDLFSLTQNRK